MMAGLQVRQLRHGFDAGAQVISLDRLDLDGGRLTVLTGPSGSGKTTLLYLLSGLLLPQQGQIAWNGLDLARMREGARDRWRRLNAGFVFQDFHLLPELSPLDNVLLPAWFSAFSAVRLRARGAALLTQFGVPDCPRAALLSRGEQQRVALARALLLKPRVIFADEPTASLDAASGASVAASLQEMAHDQGCCVIAASHDPALIALADQRLGLVRGQRVSGP